MRTVAKNAKIIYPELSYKIIGAAFSVIKVLGGGLPEKIYQKAFEQELILANISYRREKYIPFEYKKENISRQFADFIVDDKIVVELKIVPKLGYVHAKQLLGYLQSSGKKLGILIYFTRDGVKYRRVLNARTTA